MSEYDTDNGVIESVMLGLEDHGIPTCNLGIDFGGTFQAFGGYDLRHKSYGIDFLMEILKVLGVSKWEDLKGTFVRARRTHTKIIAIGHIVKDQWFEPEGWKSTHE